MSEVKRFTGDLMYGKPIESRDGVFVYAADFDRVTAELDESVVYGERISQRTAGLAREVESLTAERDAALGREAALARELEAESQGADRAAESLMEWRRDYLELQQRLTAADERADSFDRLYTSSLDERDQLQQRADVLEQALSKIKLRCDGYIEAEMHMPFYSVEACQEIAGRALKPAEGGGDEA